MIACSRAVLVASFGRVEGFELRVLLLPHDEVEGFTETLLKDEQSYISPTFFKEVAVPDSLAEGLSEEGIIAETNTSQVLDYCLDDAGGADFIKEVLLKRRSFIRIANATARRTPPGRTDYVKSLIANDYPREYLYRDLAMVNQG